MHDLVFSKEIVTIVNNRRHALPKTAKVVGVHVLLSPLSHVTAQSLNDAFTQTVSGTDLEGIALRIQALAVKMKCSACGAAFDIEKPAFACPRCGSNTIAVDDSREFLVQSIDIEET